MATITVTSASQLQDAYASLSNGSGGTITIADGAKIDKIEISGGGNAHVTITSESDPHQISKIGVTNAKNVTIDNVYVWSDDTTQLWVSGSDGVTIRNSEFASDADGMISKKGGAELGAFLGKVKGSSNFTFEGNEVHGQNQGLTLVEVKGAKVSDNEFYEVQSDGLRFEGVQDAEVTGNHMHDFFGSTHDFNHDDMFQVFDVNTSMNTKNLLIAGNIFNAGAGASSQGIFIKNEDYRSDGERFQNIEIRDNVVHNGMGNGIRVYHTDGLKIINNTVLHNTDTTTLSSANATPYNHQPKLLAEGSRNVEISGNITMNGAWLDGQKVAGNVAISYSDRHEEFVGAHKGADATMHDLQLKAGSKYVGMGASLSQPGADLSDLSWAGGSLSGSSGVSFAPVAEPDPVAFGVGTTEIEDLALSGYRAETNADASGGSWAKTDGTGTATGIFEGPAGNYDIDVSWLNEDDGVSEFELRVDGEVVSAWTGEGGSNDFATESVQVSLKGGEEIQLWGKKEWGEFARIDSLTVTEAGSGSDEAADETEETPAETPVLETPEQDAPEQDAPAEEAPAEETPAGTADEAAPAIGVGSTEVEGLALDGYAVESHGDASGDAWIRTGGEGTATGTFDGPAGTYAIDVSWLNEDDGVSEFELRVDGETVSAWTGEGGANAFATESVEVTLEGGEEIQLWGRKEWGEFARIDSLTVTEVAAGADETADEAPDDAADETVDETPAAETPADETPADDTPVAETPAEEPAADEPADEADRTPGKGAGKGGDRGDDRPGGKKIAAETEASDDDDGFFDRLVEFFQKLFGGGDDDDTEVAAVPMAVRTESATESAEVIQLAEVVPATEALDETLPEEADAGDDEDDDAVYQIAV